MAKTVVGQPLSRVDARRKVTGTATYSAEHRVEGLLYGVIVNGTVARGTVSRISVDAALGHPGVLRVLTDFGKLRLAHPVEGGARKSPPHPRGGAGNPVAADPGPPPGHGPQQT
ncbi:hypothetical protein ACFVZ2_39410, partial [Streptomyces lasiicapitis]